MIIHRPEPVRVFSFRLWDIGRLVRFPQPEQRGEDVLGAGRGDRAPVAIEVESIGDPEARGEACGAGGEHGAVQGDHEGPGLQE
ncbi:hypothetical protein [Streptomyces anulatus]|uniref:hypothetical protein n=1 Tax=Streptomyces anulatus TaxID=1892 RepID=UPI0004C65AA7|nr:hypothetical protein [Streptomyces anulatus]